MRPWRRWGVEPICEVLQIAPSTYYATMLRLPSVRWRDDEVLKGDIARIHDEHHDGIYGIEKVWWQCQREGIDVGRDRVARLIERARATWRRARRLQDGHHHVRH